MRTFLSLIAVTAAIWVGIFLTTAQARQPKAQAELHAEMETAVEEEGLVGVVWATVTPDGTTTNAVGLANAEREELLSTDGKVQTGSIVKTFIAAGILRLATEGRLELDSPVASLLPHVKFENPWASSNPVLVRHLLDHTSGLDDARLWQVFSLNAKPDTPLSASIQPGRLQIRSRPGSRLSYSNIGYTLLGMLIEHVTDDHRSSFGGVGGCGIWPRLEQPGSAWRSRELPYRHYGGLPIKLLSVPRRAEGVLRCNECRCRDSKL